MVRARSKISSLALLVTVALLGLLPVTAHGQDATPAAVAGKILRVFAFGFPDTLDPQMADFSHDVAGLNYEGLTRIDEHVATVPGAAESWEFDDDGTLLTFHLREGLTYSDGSPLTADDFAYAVERTCDPRTAAPYASFIFAIAGCEAWATSLEAAIATPLATPVAGAEAAYEEARAALGVRAVDDRTLELTLVEPAPYLPTVASTWLFHPVPREVIASDPEGWWRDPANLIGNGPFQVSQIDGEAPDQRIRFVANERYWGGRPQLDGIDYVYFDDSEVELDAYKRGDLDIGWTPYPFGNQPEIADDPALSQEILVIPFATTLLFSIDLTQEPFQDKKVREAFAYGLDREGYCRDLWSGACAPALSWIPPGTPGHIETTKYAFDPAAAKLALAESSYGGPENLPEVTWRYYVGEGDAQSREEAAWLAENYREPLGVELNLAPTTDEEFQALDEAGTIPQLGYGRWIQDYPDPQDWFTPFWTCNAPYNAQVVGYCNPALDTLVAQADRELDPVKRLALYEEAGQLLVDDVPTLFFLYDTNPVLVRPYVTGYVAAPRDPWPGWSTPLTVDLLPVEGPEAATPVS